MLYNDFDCDLCSIDMFLRLAACFEFCSAVYAWIIRTTQYVCMYTTALSRSTIRQHDSAVYVEMHDGGCLYECGKACCVVQPIASFRYVPHTNHQAPACSLRITCSTGPLQKLCLHGHLGCTGYRNTTGNLIFCTYKIYTLSDGVYCVQKLCRNTDMTLPASRKCTGSYSMYSVQDWCRNTIGHVTFLAHRKYTGAYGMYCIQEHYRTRDITCTQEMCL